MPSHTKAERRKRTIRQKAGRRTARPRKSGVNARKRKR